MKDLLIILVGLAVGVTTGILLGQGGLRIYEHAEVLAECNKIKKPNEICITKLVAKRYKLNEQPNIPKPL